MWRSRPSPRWRASASDAPTVPRWRGSPAIGPLTNHDNTCTISHKFTRIRSRHRGRPRETNEMHDYVRQLLDRSHRLGADPRNTNYAGGNTSAKGTDIDPVTGEPVELMWVKGSGGDLGTLTEAGLAVLRLDRLRASSTSTRARNARTRWSPRSTSACHGKGGAAPSIDTAMHGLVAAAHVDHLHPDSGIAIADRRRRRAAHQGHLRRPRRVGAVATPRLPARTRHRRDPRRPSRSRSA